MADPKTKLESLIEENGGRLVRQKKHKVYRFPNGATFVVSSTPECPLAYDNAVAHLRRLLGIYPPDRGAPGTRRNKKLKQKQKNGLSVIMGTSSVKMSTWENKLKVVATRITPPAIPPPKVPRPQRTPTFEELMLKSGVKKIHHG